MKQTPFMTVSAIEVTATFVRVEDDGIEELTKDAERLAVIARNTMGFGGVGDGLPYATFVITIKNIERETSALHKDLDNLKADAFIAWHFYFE